MSVFYGNDTLTVTDPDTEETLVYPLRIPLQQVQPSTRRRRYITESLDYSTRQIITIGSTKYEYSGQIRLDENPALLLRVLTLGADGEEVTYYDSRNAETHHCMLLEPGGDLIELLRDLEFSPRFVEYSVRIRLRKNEVGDFDDSIPVVSS